MSQVPAPRDLIEKYQRLLRDGDWPRDNRTARRAVRELLAALEEATRG